MAVLLSGLLRFVTFSTGAGILLLARFANFWVKSRTLLGAAGRAVAEVFDAPWQTPSS
jgi:hypothetical protein